MLDFGDWEAWLRFFLTGVEETAKQAGQTAKALMKLAAEDEKRIQSIGKASGSALRVHRFLQAQPILSIASACEELKLTVPTVTSAPQTLGKTRHCSRNLGAQLAPLLRL